jgi:tape measure domain-containing protein
MAKFIDIVLRAKDFFSAKTDKAAESIGSLKTELNGLDKELKEVEGKQAAIKVFSELGVESKALAQGVDEAQASLRGYAQQQAKASGEVSEAEQAYKELKAQVAALNSSYSAQTKALAASNNSLDKATATANKYGDAVNSNKLSIAKTNKEYLAQKAVFDQLEKKYKSTKAPLDKLSESYKNAKGQLTALEQVQKSQLRALTKSEASYQAAKDDLAGLEKTQRSYAKALDSTKAALKENTRLQAEAVAKQKAANLELTNVAANYKAAAKAIQVLSTRLAKASADLAKANSKLEAAGIDVNNLADATDKLSNKQKKLISATQKAASSLSGLTAKLKGVKGALNKAGAGVSGFTGRLAALAGTYIGIRGLTNSLVSFIQVGAKFEVFRKQFEGIMGSVAQGEQAFQWVKDFARETPLDMEQTTQAFVMLKGAGLDPMDGTLRALTDTTAKYTGGTAKLANITRQLSQAWAKGRINADDMRIAVDNGLPAWVLLSQATGKTVGQLRNLSEAGKLGRYELKLLFQELGNDAMGSAAKLMGTFNGQLAVAKFNIQEFLDTVAQSGALDYLTDKLTNFNAKVKEMAADGSLKIFAKQLSDDFIVVGESLYKLVTTLASDLPDFVRKVNFSFGLITATTNAVTIGMRLVISSFSALFKIQSLGMQQLTSAFGTLPNVVSKAHGKMAAFWKSMEDTATKQAVQDIKEFNLAVARMSENSGKAGADLDGFANKVGTITKVVEPLGDALDATAEQALVMANGMIAAGDKLTDTELPVERLKETISTLIAKLLEDPSPAVQQTVSRLNAIYASLGDQVSETSNKVVKTLADLELEFESIGGKTLTNLQENVEKTVTVFNKFTEAKKPISELRQAFEQQLAAQLELAKAQNDYGLPANLAQQASVLGLSDSYDNANEKLDKHNESFKQNIVLAERAKGGSVYIAKDIRLGADAYANLTDHIKENTRTKSIAAAVGQIYDKSVARSSAIYDHSASSTEEMTERLQGLNDELSHMNKATMPSSLAGLDLFLMKMDDLVKQGIENERSTIQQTLAYNALVKSLSAGEFGLAKLNQLTNTADYNFKNLDASSLSNLKSEIESAKASLLGFNQEISATVNNLRNELDSLEGNRNAVLARDYEAKKIELQNALKEAKEFNQSVANFGEQSTTNADSAKAVKEAKEALALAEKIYQIKSKTIVAEQKETINTTKKVTENTNTNTNIKEVRNVQDIRYTVTFKAGNTSATFNEGGKNVEQLLQYLQDAGLTVTRG